MVRAGGNAHPEGAVEPSSRAAPPGPVEDREDGRQEGGMAGDQERSKTGGGLLSLYAPDLAELYRDLQPVLRVQAQIATLYENMPWRPESLARLAEREQERYRAAVGVQKLVDDIAKVVPCLAEQLARERTPGWSPAEDAEQVARRRDAYLAGWHAVHEVQRYVRL